MTERPLFDQEVGDRFRGDYYDQIRGHVREEVTRRNLVAAFPEIQDPGLRVLDIGGGEGRDSFWLASLGHGVVLLDESSEMLARAAEAQSQFDSSIATRVQLVHGTSEQLNPAPDQAFDLVLSHGVLMYLENPGAHVHEMLRLSKPNAHLSVLTRGYEATVSRLLAQSDLASLHRLKTDSTYVNNLGAVTWPYSPDKLARLLQRSGLHVDDWFGVRVQTDADTRPWRSISSDEVETILNVEEAFGRNPTTRGLGQMIHMLASKRPPTLRHR